MRVAVSGMARYLRWVSVDVIEQIPAAWLACVATLAAILVACLLHAFVQRFIGLSAGMLVAARRDAGAAQSSARGFSLWVWRTPLDRARLSP